MFHLVYMKLKNIKQSMLLSNYRSSFIHFPSFPLHHSHPSRHSFFKSKTRRKIFLPVNFHFHILSSTFFIYSQKIGPAPGEYEPQMKTTNTTSPTITSSFRSRTDRFHKKSARNPGPGTYEKLILLPKHNQIDRYSTRGVFFNANFSPMASMSF